MKKITLIANTAIGLFLISSCANNSTTSGHNTAYNEPDETVGEAIGSAILTSIFTAIFDSAIGSSGSGSHSHGHPSDSEIKQIQHNLKNAYN